MSTSKFDYKELSCDEQTALWENLDKEIQGRRRKKHERDKEDQTKNAKENLARARQMVIDTPYTGPTDNVITLDLTFNLMFEGYTTGEWVATSEVEGGVDQSSINDFISDYIEDLDLPVFDIEPEYCATREETIEAFTATLKNLEAAKPFTAKVILTSKLDPDGEIVTKTKVSSDDLSEKKLRKVRKWVNDSVQSETICDPEQYLVVLGAFCMGEVLEGRRKYFQDIAEECNLPLFSEFLNENNV
jgi:hypothetical protein